MTVNSTSEIQQRVAAGKITWAGPLIMLVARSVFLVICQGLVAAIFFRGSADAWNEAGHWYPVYGTVTDAGCIVLLLWLTRREGIRLFDLGSYRRKGWLRDVLIGLGLLIPLLPLLAVLPPIAGRALFYGGQPPQRTPLPVWGFIFSLIIWQPIWAFTEDNTYFGYSLPRLEALTGRKWLAVVVMSFFLTLQHVFLPFRLEWQALAFTFVAFVPLSVVWSLIYLRQRRLLPLHIIHWGFDLVTLLSFFLPSTGGG
jgi:membrane protease YdiL (CAAX protease family)